MSQFHVRDGAVRTTAGNFQLVLTYEVSTGTMQSGDIYTVDIPDAFKDGRLYQVWIPATNATTTPKIQAATDIQQWDICQFDGTAIRANEIPVGLNFFTCYQSKMYLTPKSQIDLANKTVDFLTPITTTNKGATIADVKNMVTNLLTLKGYISTDDPTTKPGVSVADFALWYQGADFPTVTGNPPTIIVKQYGGGSWFRTISYRLQFGDTFVNLNTTDNDEKFWNGMWSDLNFTIDLSSYRTAVQQDAIDSAITTAYEAADTALGTRIDDLETDLDDYTATAPKTVNSVGVGTGADANNIIIDAKDITVDKTAATGVSIAASLTNINLETTADDATIAKGTLKFTNSANTSKDIPVVTNKTLTINTLDRDGNVSTSQTFDGSTDTTVVIAEAEPITNGDRSINTFEDLQSACSEFYGAIIAGTATWTFENDITMTGDLDCMIADCEKFTWEMNGFKLIPNGHTFNVKAENLYIENSNGATSASVGVGGAGDILFDVPHLVSLGLDIGSEFVVWLGSSLYLMNGNVATTPTVNLHNFGTVNIGLGWQGTFVPESSQGLIIDNRVATSSQPNVDTYVRDNPSDKLVRATSDFVTPVTNTNLGITETEFDKAVLSDDVRNVVPILWNDYEILDNNNQVDLETIYLIENDPRDSAYNAPSPTPVDAPVVDVEVNGVSVLDTADNIAKIGIDNNTIINTGTTSVVLSATGVDMYDTYILQTTSAGGNTYQYIKVNGRAYWECVVSYSYYTEKWNYNSLDQAASPFGMEGSSQSNDIFYYRNDIDSDGNWGWFPHPNKRVQITVKVPIKYRGFVSLATGDLSQFVDAKADSTPAPYVHLGAYYPNTWLEITPTLTTHLQEAPRMEVNLATGKQRQMFGRTGKLLYVKLLSTNWATAGTGLEYDAKQMDANWTPNNNYYLNGTDSRSSYEYQTLSTGANYYDSDVSAYNTDEAAPAMGGQGLNVYYYDEEPNTVHVINVAMRVYFNKGEQSPDFTG